MPAHRESRIAWRARGAVWWEARSRARPGAACAIGSAHPVFGWVVFVEPIAGDVGKSTLTGRLDVQDCERKQRGEDHRQHAEDRLDHHAPLGHLVGGGQLPDELTKAHAVCNEAHICLHAVWPGHFAQPFVLVDQRRWALHAELGRVPCLFAPHLAQNELIPAQLKQPLALKCSRQRALNLVFAALGQSVRLRSVCVPRAGLGNFLQLDRAGQWLGVEASLLYTQCCHQVLNASPE